MKGKAQLTLSIRKDPFPASTVQAWNVILVGTTYSLENANALAEWVDQAIKEKSAGRKLNGIVLPKGIAR